MHAWDCLLDDAPGWIEMNAHKRKQANNDLNHADYFWVSRSIIHMTPSTIFSAGCTVLKKFYMPELKRPLIADVILQPGDAWITARLCRLAVPCHVLMSEGRGASVGFLRRMQLFRKDAQHDGQHHVRQGVPHRGVHPHQQAVGDEAHQPDDQIARVGGHGKAIAL